MTRPKIVVAGRVGAPRLTDDLTLAGTLRVLADADATVVVIATDPEHTLRTHGVAAVPAHVASLAAAAMEEADLVLIAGGRVLPDIGGSRALANSLSQICMARASGVTVLPYGIEIGAAPSQLERRIIRAVLTMTSPGLLRDDVSASAWHDLGGHESSVAPDLAFVLQPPLVRSEERIVVCLRPVSGSIQGPFIEAIAAALQDASHRTGLPVRFLSLDPALDGAIHARVAERMVGVDTTQTSADLEGVLPEFGKASVVVTMHHHGVVGAILGGRPVVAVDHKAQVQRVTAPLPAKVARTTSADPAGLATLADLVVGMVGNDADVIDSRDELRARMIRARSVIERTLYNA